MIDLGILTVVLLLIRVLEDDAVHWACIFNVVKDCSAFILRFKQSSSLGLLGHEGEGTTSTVL